MAFVAEGYGKSCTPASRSYYSYFNPILGLMLLVIFAAVVAITRYVSLGSCIAAFVMPALAIVLVPDFFWFAVIIAAIIIIKHRANLARIVRGEESKLSFSK